MTSFFSERFGRPWNYNRWPTLARWSDGVFRRRVDRSRRLRRIVAADRARPDVSILAIGVEVPGREADMAAVMARLSDSRHRVDCIVWPLAPKGKFENVNDALATIGAPLDRYDYLIVVDDDVAMPDDFTDRYVALVRHAGLAISQPAHAWHSFASFAINQRRFRPLVRQTGFVEIGPMTVIARAAFDHVLPFPNTRWAWGVDLLWADLALRHGWRMGVVDALAVRHLRPVGGTYAGGEAIREAEALFVEHGISLRRRDVLRTRAVLL